ncbi:N-acetylglucosamine kinase [Paenibacillus sp. N3/727]|uniref:N-acetylglucosamine kinase n=1 Tax=Paenibacillus sp. N3/727 TaxID=2925845 RepID=UPI001F531093|nr:BadF/BadG/BcrA/BcrD ATPase family protein [Paenibacillus sp. N3/727]UNK19987.1 N-acetylglucosamine kinase [Paenibacillus sp. N3/727]
MDKHTIPLLAIDGGGTKCLAVFTDRQGNILGQGKGGSSNYQGSGKDGVIRELKVGIEEAVADLCERNGIDVSHVEIEVECAVFALAGLDTEYDRRIITGLVEEVLKLLPIQVKHLIVENDGYAALLGATDGDPGILAIAGTGSIIFGINDQGQTARAGGWGHRVGDEGSGYWIGKQAVMAILKAYDGRNEGTRLGKWVLPHFGMENEEDLFNWVYGPEYSVEKVSELSRAVGQAASDGDKEAHQILEVAAHELFIAVAAVIRHLSFQNKPFTMILLGGVLQHEGYVRDMLMHKIKAHAPQVQWDKARKEPIYGVTAMGLSYLETKVSTKVQ